MGNRQDTLPVGTVAKLSDGRIRVTTHLGDVFESPKGSVDWPTIEVFYDRGVVTFRPGAGTLDPRDATILSVVLRMEPGAGRWDDLVGQLSTEGQRFLDRVLAKRGGGQRDEDNKGTT